MDSLNPRITNNSSRPEIDHSKSSDNVLLKLNIDSYSEPMHYDYHTANKLQNNENISTQPQISTTHNKNRLEISFNEFVDTHRSPNSSPKYKFYEKRALIEIRYKSRLYVSVI
eukprot:385331_1